MAGNPRGIDLFKNPDFIEAFRGSPVRPGQAEILETQAWRSVFHSIDKQTQSTHRLSMTYWGAPSPGGSKFYLGSSGDTAWNHDILWKSRVEKEVAELDPEEDIVQGYSEEKYLAGVSDRQWLPHENERLKEAIRVHGANSFGVILGNPQFASLRNHSEQALKEQWRHLEYMRGKSLKATTSAWRKPTESEKRALVSRQRAMAKKAKQMQQTSKSPHNVRMSWRGSGSMNRNKSLVLPQVSLSPLQKMAASANKHPDLKARSYLSHLTHTLKKETMKRDQLKRTLDEQQKQRDSSHLDLLQERKMRRKAENALKKYQNVLANLAQKRGFVDSPMKSSVSSPLLRTMPNSKKYASPSAASKQKRREYLKSMLMSAEMGMGTVGSPALLNTQASGFF